MNYKAYETELKIISDELAEGAIDLKEYNRRLREIESEATDD